MLMMAFDWLGNTSYKCFIVTFSLDGTTVNSTQPDVMDVGINTFYVHLLCPHQYI